MKRSGAHILLAVPTRGQIQWQTVTRLEEIRDGTPGLAPILYEPGNLSVAQTRNQIVRKFMETDKSLLVMVDDDVVPPPHLLETCFASMGDYAMVGVPYPLWQSEPGIFLSVFRRESEGLKLLTEFDHGLNEVDALGTGCVAISRDALALMGRNPFRFDTSPELEGTSEDFIFCSDLQAKGMRIAAWWDGWYADHVRVTGLAPILESMQRSRPVAERST